MIKNVYFHGINHFGYEVFFIIVRIDGFYSITQSKSIYTAKISRILTNQRNHKDNVITFEYYLEDLSRTTVMSLQQVRLALFKNLKMELI